MWYSHRTCTHELGGHLCQAACTLISGVASMPEQGASDPMQGWWQTQAEGKHPSLVEGLQWLQTLNEQAKESEKADTQKAAGLWPLTMSHHARFLDPGLHTGSSVTPSARRPALRSLAGESKAGCAVVTWPVVFSRLWLT
ncbi:hypothetical protein WJX82_011747 [Trebouxia sp. C0006]